MRFNPKEWKKNLLFQVLLIISGISGCSDRPSNTQLKAWQQEAITKNHQKITAKVIEANQKNWKITIP